MQVGGGGVNCRSGQEKSEAKDETHNSRRGGLEFTHHPEGYTAIVTAGQCGHEKHNDGLQERSRNDAGEEQSGAVNLTFAEAEEIDYGDRKRSAEESTNGRQDGGDGRRKG